MEKKKAPLALMELLIMLLVFALCAAVSLQAFAASRAISQRQSAREAAAILAQNEAEEIKAAGGMEGEYTETHGGMTLTVRPIATDFDTLGKAEITVTEEGEALFSLTVAWQEVGHG